MQSGRWSVQSVPTRVPAAAVTIIEFIEERLAEDEAAARRVSSSRWNAGFYEDHPGEYVSVLEDIDAPVDDDGFANFYDGRGYAATHAARHDPARVLREVTAKRRILGEIFDNASGIDGEWGDGHTAAEIRTGLCDDHGGSSAAKLLGMMATIWSDHPDYQQDWAL